MATTVQTILDFLDANVSSGPRTDLEDFVSHLKFQIDQLSIDISGAQPNAITLLYSGFMPDGTHTGAVAANLVSNNPGKYLTINQTEVSELLSSDQFEAKLLAALGGDQPTLDNILTGEDPSGNRISNNSLWDDASRRFAQNASGNVQVLGALADPSRVFAATELITLLENSGATSIDDIPIEDYIRLRNTEGFDAVLDAVKTNSLKHVHFSGLLDGDFSNFTTFSTDLLNDTILDDPTKLESFHSLLSDLEGNPNYVDFNRGADALRRMGELANDIGVPAALNKAGFAGDLAALFFVTYHAVNLYNAGDEQGAADAMSEWGVEMLGGVTGAKVGATLGTLATALLVAGGATVSAPLAGAIAFGAAVTGAIFGGDAARTLWELRNDNDGNGHRDIVDRFRLLIYGSGTITTPIPWDINTTQVDLDISLTVDEIVANAQTDIAWRYTLRELNPFVVTGMDYSSLNSDGSLDLFDPQNANNGMNEQYLRDRAEMLFWKIRFDNGELDEDDAPRDFPKSYTEDWDTSRVDGNYDYVDLDPARALPGGQPLEIAIDGRGVTSQDHQIVFGSGDADTIQGSSVSDRLHGLQGNDTLEGGDGEDYLSGGAGDDHLTGGVGSDVLEGGAGFDTYYFSAGDGVDTIVDNGGLIWLDNNSANARLLSSITLTAITPAGNVYQELDGNGEPVNDDVFVLSGNDLIVNVGGTHTGDKIRIKDFDKTNNGFNLTFDDNHEPQEPVQDGTIYVVGDGSVAGGGTLSPTYQSRQSDPSQSAINTQDIQFNAALATELWNYDGNASNGYTFEGGDGNDQLVGGQYRDWLHGREGDDHIEAGEGQHTGDPDGSNFIEGGTGSDYLIGGIHTDVIPGNDHDKWAADNVTQNASYQSESFSSSDYIDGGAGRDFLSGDEGDDIVIWALRPGKYIPRKSAFLWR